MEKKKILIVDDEEKILRLLSKILSSGGFQVIRASNGKEAVQKTREYMPHLILMDILMPDMDGADAVRLIKGDPEIANIPILFLTGIISPQEKSQVPSVNVGGHSYDAIPKPFHFNELISEVRSVLG